MRIEKDFEELLQLLKKHNVKFCIVGSFALAIHARPRYTKDMDILIEPAEANTDNVLKALTEFGFPLGNLSAADFAKPDNIVQLGFEPVRIDVISSIAGVTFDEVWENRYSGTYGDTPVDFIGLDQLIKNKRAAGRPQDLVDVETLLKYKGKGNGV
jgi:predicted nucleotidyltransferase